MGRGRPVRDPSQGIGWLVRGVFALIVTAQMPTFSTHLPWMGSRSIVVAPMVPGKGIYLGSG